MVLDSALPNDGLRALPLSFVVAYRSINRLDFPGKRNPGSGCTETNQLVTHGPASRQRITVRMLVRIPLCDLSRPTGLLFASPVNAHPAPLHAGMPRQGFPLSGS